MENASKALLMAAGVLMTVLVLTLGLYLYASFSDSSKQMQDKISEANLDEFNNQFLSYTGINPTIYDILNLVNLADDCNERYEYTATDNYHIEIIVGGSKMNNNLTSEKIQLELNKLPGGSCDYAYIKDGTLALKRCQCTKVEYSQATGKVQKMVFTEFKTSIP